MYDRQYNFLRTAPRNLRKWEGGIVLRDEQSKLTYDICFAEKVHLDNRHALIRVCICKAGKTTPETVVVDEQTLDLPYDAGDGDVRQVAAWALQMIGCDDAILDRLTYLSSYPENFAFCPHLTDDIEGNGVCEFDGADCRGCTLGRSYRDDP